METEKAEEPGKDNPWGEKGRPQWLENMLQPSGTEPSHHQAAHVEREQPTRVTMENAQCHNLIQSILKQDLRILNETAQQIEPPKGTARYKKHSTIANDLIEFKASLGAIERFVNDLAAQTKNETIQFSLSRLPERWQDTFPTIRQHAIETAKGINKEFAKKLARPSDAAETFENPEKAMKHLPQQVNDAQRDTLHELIQLVHSLDTVHEALQAHLPVEALKQRAVPVINITREEAGLLLGSPHLPTLDKVLKIGAQYTPHVSLPNAMLKLEELHTQLSPDATDTRVARATIPDSREVQEYLNEVRTAVISGMLKDKARSQILSSLLDNSEPPTLSPQTIGKLVLAANFKTGIQDEAIMRHLSIQRPDKNEEAGYYGVLPDETRILPSTDPLRTPLDDCLALDMATITWTKALDSIGERMAKYENTPQTTAQAR